MEDIPLKWDFCPDSRGLDYKKKKKRLMNSYIVSKTERTKEKDRLLNIKKETQTWETALTLPRISHKNY